VIDLDEGSLRCEQAVERSGSFGLGARGLAGPYGTQCWRYSYFDHRYFLHWYYVLILMSLIQGIYCMRARSSASNISCIVGVDDPAKSELIADF